ncbi:MAG TPA: ABC transporter permease [Candidatus Corynebacterium gallistercoris]|uniref:ABC transporter permease n=1 Tax=Candidatus Corynebacterium gallistercoris TaxID=2838530 RepID=A0A9D1RWK0_9CORY|nr:ABC transporter permease [Candidatus Corynebacterium gallistercoris]
MLNIINSEWIRTRSLVGTWVMLGFAFVFISVPSLFLLSYYLGEFGWEEPFVSVTSVLLGSLPALLVIVCLSAVRVSSARNHNLHAQSFLVIKARWSQLAASMVVNVLLSVVTVVVGIAAALAILTIAPQPLNFDYGSVLVWLVAIAAMLSLIGSSLGVIIPSTAGAVCLPLVWMVVEQILPTFSRFLGEFVVPYLPVTNMFWLINPELAAATHGSATSGIILALWTGLLMAAAFYVNESRDVK